MPPSIPARRNPWLNYRAVWRWHFYAGLFCIPIVCALSITGSIYLFKPQVEAWLDRPYDQLSIPQTARPSQVVQAALAAHPNWTFHAYELPRTSHSAGIVLLRRDGEILRVYVDRGSLKILKSIAEDQRLMPVVSRVHGELLLGDRGSIIVELAASWAIVMILTGLYLWWPRHAQGFAGVIYPRLGGGKRLFWRDIHAVTGVWVSVFALLMLFSGLPWSKNWGGYLKEIRRLTGTASVRQDWTTGRASEIAARKAMDSGGMSAMNSEHGEHTYKKSHIDDKFSPQAALALDRVTPTVAALGLAAPVLVVPPSHQNGSWSGKSNTQNRPLRVDVKLDPTTGAVTSRSDFSQRNAIDRIVSIGIAVHEGQLFGWPNQLLGLFVAVSLVTVSVSAVVLWWRRRASGVLGAPVPNGYPRFSAGLVGIVVILCILLPLFGVSLMIVMLAERLILRRVPVVCTWLGLQPA